MSTIDSLELKLSKLRFATARMRSAPVWDKAAAAEQAVEAVEDLFADLIQLEIQRQQKGGAL